MLGSMSITNLLLMACSSMAEQGAVNSLVASSSLATPVCSNNSAVECLLYTERVGGSNPSSSIPIRRIMKNDYCTMQKLQCGNLQQ